MKRKHKEKKRKGQEVFDLKRPINPFKRIKLLELKTAKLEKAINRIDLLEQKAAKLEKAINNIDMSLEEDTMEYGKVNFLKLVRIVTRQNIFMQDEINRLKADLNRLKFGDD